MVHGMDLRRSDQTCPQFWDVGSTETITGSAQAGRRADWSGGAPLCVCVYACM